VLSRAERGSQNMSGSKSIAYSSIVLFESNLYPIPNTSSVTISMRLSPDRLSILFIKVESTPVRVLRAARLSPWQ
jgi:hypothetical protein